MTRRHFLPIAALIALASCNGKKADNTTDSSASSAAEAQEPTKELIEKEIFVESQFSYITNLSSIKIVDAPMSTQDARAWNGGSAPRV